MTRTHRSSHALVAALIAAIGIAAGARAATAQPKVDPSYDPKSHGTNEKMRYIRTGDSIGDLRANAMQSMDFGFDILDRIMAKESMEYVYTTMYWTKEFDKWTLIWERAMDELNTVMAKKNMSSSKQDAWRQKYDSFFAELRADGLAVVAWKREVHERKYWLDEDIGNFPYRERAILDALKEAEALLAEADRVARGSASASQIKTQIENTKKAYNLARAASGVLETLREEVVDKHGNRKATLDSKIVKIANRWNSIRDHYPDLMKRWTDKVQKWARSPKKTWKDYLDARKKRDDKYKTILKKGRFDDYPHFKGVAFDKLETAATKVQSRLEAKLR